MRSSTFIFTDEDGIEIFVYKWEPNAECKAVIQIHHGLAEHAKRYSRLAEILCKEGYACYANDARGHGLTAGDLTEATLEGNAGVLGPKGWRGVVSDARELTNIIKNENQNIPLFFLGHSWGAMIAQDYIQEWGDDLKGCILSGTNGEVVDVVPEEYKEMLKHEINEIGPTAPSQKMYDLNFKSFNQEWQDNEGATGFEWLSRDKTEVQKYTDDPWCGFVPPATLWLDFTSGLEKVYNVQNELKIPKNLPIHIIAGALDPVGNKAKGIIAMVNRLKKYGIKDVTYKLYKEARHELFNEINRNKVFEDVIGWLNSHL